MCWLGRHAFDVPYTSVLPPSPHVFWRQFKNATLPAAHEATTTGHEAEKSGQMARWLRSNITEQYDNNWHFYPDTLDFSLLIASHRWSLSGNSWRSGELWLSLSGRVAKWTHSLNEVQSKQHMTALLSLTMHMTTGLLPCMAWKVGCIIMSGFKVGPKRRRHDSPLAHRPTAAEWGAFMALPGPEGGWNGQVVPWDEIHKTSLELSPVPQPSVESAHALAVKISLLLLVVFVFLNCKNGP